MGCNGKGNNGAGLAAAKSTDKKIIELDSIKIITIAKKELFLVIFFSSFFALAK